MKLLYEKYKTKDRVYNKILRRYWNDIEGIDFDYEDALIVAVEFYPISVFKLLKMSYWKMIDTYDCPTKDMHELDEFFEKNFIYASEDNLLKPFDCGYCFSGYGEWSPCLELDCNRAYVYRRFRLVFVKDRMISANPLYLLKERSDIKCIRINNKRLKNYDELREEIRCWLQKIKDATDEDRRNAGEIRVE